jgi:hypothetical protein
VEGARLVCRVVLIRPSWQRVAMSTVAEFSYCVGDYRGETSWINRAWKKEANMNAQAYQVRLYKDFVRLAVSPRAGPSNNLFSLPPLLLDTR